MVTGSSSNWLIPIEMNTCMCLCLITCLLPGTIRLTRLILCISYSTLRTNHFCKAIGVLSLERNIKRQGLDTRCTCCYCMSLFLDFSTDEARINVCILGKSYSSFTQYMCVSAIISMCKSKCLFMKLNKSSC